MARSRVCVLILSLSSLSPLRPLSPPFSDLSFSHKEDALRREVRLIQLRNHPVGDHHRRATLRRWTHVLEDKTIHEGLRPTIPSTCDPTYATLMKRCWVCSNHTHHKRKEELKGWFTYLSSFRLIDLTFVPLFLKWFNPSRPSSFGAIILRGSSFEAIILRGHHPSGPSSFGAIILRPL